MSSTVLPRRKSGTWLVLLGHALAKMINAYRRHQAARALHQLPDHMLRDIGISRSEIEYTVDKGRFR